MAVFSATNSTTQAITGGARTEVVFGTEEFDAASAFASNRFTVPAGLDGSYGVLTFGVLFADTETFDMAIEVSTNGGSSWSEIGREDINSVKAGMVTTGVVALNNGDIYRAIVLPSSAATIQNVARVFFRGVTFAIASP